MIMKMIMIMIMIMIIIIIIIIIIITIIITIITVKDHPPWNCTHTEKVPVHQINNSPGTSGTRNGPSSRGV